MRITNIIIIKQLWVGLIILSIFTPLGLIVPDYFQAGSAWGEWNTNEIQKFVGYLPSGLEKFTNLWDAPMPDYAFKGWESKGIIYLSFAYIIAAIIGITIVGTLTFFLGKMLAKNNE